jgi:hypothetical protein
MTCNEFQITFGQVHPLQATSPMILAMAIHMKECPSCKKWMRQGEDPDEKQHPLMTFALQRKARMALNDCQTDPELRQQMEAYDALKRKERK